jgi:hypothetical protein
MAWVLSRIGLEIARIYARLRGPEEFAIVVR